jgi:hypothetical protein
MMNYPNRFCRLPVSPNEGNKYFSSITGTSLTFEIDACSLKVAFFELGSV